MRVARLFLALSAACAVILAACGPAASATPPAVLETVEVPVTVPPADAGKLVVYSGRSESLVAPIIAQFAEVTGIQVEVRYGSTAEIAAALLEEGANSPADVFFAQDPGGLGAVAEAGLFAPLPDTIVDLVDQRFASPDNLWVGISGRARVVVYNTDTLSPDTLPADIADFADPAWHGRLGWAPTNGSLQAMITAMRVAWGEDQTRAWLEGVLANEPVAYENNAAVVAGVAAGEVEAGFVNHYYLYRFLAEEGEGFKARNYFLPGGGPGSLVMAAGAGRLVNGPNEANALKFIDFMLSTVAQQFFSSQTYEYPLVAGVVTQPGLTPLAELNALEVDMVQLADLAGTTALMSEVGILP